MNKSLMISKRLCAFFIAYVVMSSAAALPVFALGAETGSITVKPQYNNQMVEGCTFKLYQVAVCNSGSAPVFTLTADFQGANVDINDVAVSHAADRETAVETLLKLAADSPVCTDTAANGSNEFKGLDLGAYLVVQDSAPEGYQYASEFLVFLPSVDINGRLITAIDASPKLDNPGDPIPGGDVTAVNVIKKWEDNEDANRPTSVKAALYNNNEVLVETVELNDANNWSHSWDRLDVGSWMVKEINVPVGYAVAILKSEVVDGVVTFTIYNTKAAVPIDGELTVTKVWVNDKSTSRPTKVEITLFCNGEAYNVVELNAENGWIHKWTELNENDRWTVVETSNHSGYTVTVSAAEGGYIIYNTYSNEDKHVKPGSNGGGGGGRSTYTHQTLTIDTITTLSDPAVTINNEAPPLAPAPQTGLLQWPIPVLMVSGLWLIVLGYRTDQKRQYA